MLDKTERFLSVIVMILFIMTMIRIGKHQKFEQIQEEPKQEPIIIETQTIKDTSKEIIIDPELERQKIYMLHAENYINSLSNDSEYIINRIILDMRESDFDNSQKICTIAGAIAEFGNIKYENGSNLFNWNNEIFDEDFLQPGCYYKSGMTFDCSGFIQYLVWVSTGTSTKDGILIGRGTYFSSIEGISVKEPEKGTLCFRYNGGSGIKRTGEEMRKNELPTQEANHVAIYLGNNKYIDCSEKAGGVRIIDITDNPYYEEFFNWYRNVLIYDSYTTTLEQSF